MNWKESLFSDISLSQCSILRETCPGNQACTWSLCLPSSDQLQNKTLWNTRYKHEGSVCGSPLGSSTSNWVLGISSRPILTLLNLSICSGWLKHIQFFCTNLLQRLQMDLAVQYSIIGLSFCLLFFPHGASFSAPYLSLLPFSDLVTNFLKCSVQN